LKFGARLSGRTWQPCRLSCGEGAGRRRRRKRTRRRRRRRKRRRRRRRRKTRKKRGSCPSPVSGRLAPFSNLAVQASLRPLLPKPLGLGWKEGGGAGGAAVWTVAS
jgi:hypothetical protein